MLAGATSLGNAWACPGLQPSMEEREKERKRERERERERERSLTLMAVSKDPAITWSPGS